MEVRNATSSRSAGRNENAKPSRSAQVASVRKAMELLGAFTPQTPAWALSDLARLLQIPKSTAHNLLQTLKDFDLVQQDDTGRLYRLGPRAMELGLTFARGNGVLAHARAVMNRLAEQTGETVKFGVLSNNQVLIVAAVESPRQLHTRGDLGTRWPLHSSSLGKAMLSILPWDETVSILTQTGLPGFTKTTLQSLHDVEREMKQIRVRGFALDLQENEPGVCCVAAPIADPLHGTVAAISISGPSARLGDTLLSELGQQVVAAGRAILNHSQRVL
ncbi:MAG TPA: IclR family transcriptional regulator [Bryobacteraceae bacterium]|nr:IclR family transcriptional regulator [Bryobacteraceae bacterium]